MEYNIGTKIKELRKARKLTLQDVAERFGLTRERIRQIEAAAMKKLRATLAA